MEGSQSKWTIALIKFLLLFACPPPYEIPFHSCLRSGTNYTLRDKNAGVRLADVGEGESIRPGEMNIRFAIGNRRDKTKQSESMFFRTCQVLATIILHQTPTQPLEGGEAGQFWWRDLCYTNVFVVSITGCRQIVRLSMRRRASFRLKTDQINLLAQTDWHVKWGTCVCV